MSKHLDDAWTRQYKKNLEELQKIVNMKPSEEILEKLRQRYVKVRDAHETKPTV
jgi:hypothetical protein